MYVQILSVIFLSAGDSICDKPDYILEEDVTTFTFNPHHNLSLGLQREKLPITNIKEHILYSLDLYQTVVLIGETGSGKSTQVPQVSDYYNCYLLSYTFIFMSRNL